jgi:DnaK suppressor protein
MPKKNGVASRKKFLAAMRKRLENMRTQLANDVDEELRTEREGNKDEGMDTYDLASEERARELSSILSDRELNKIREIEDAIERLDEDAFGVCEGCGMDIAEARLEAMPFTRLCRDCQQDFERKERAQRRVEGERFTYRRVGSADNDEEGV